MCKYLIQKVLRSLESFFCFKVDIKIYLIKEIVYSMKGSNFIEY